MRMLGRLHLKEQIKKYRENGIPEIDSGESKDTVLDFLKQRLGTNLESWQGGMGTIIYRNLVPPVR
jgi:hypothetical protein